MPTPSQLAEAEDIAQRAKREDRDLTLEELERYDALMRGLITVHTDSCEETDA